MLGGIVRGRKTALRTPTEADLVPIGSWMADMRVRRAGQLWHEPASLATWKERLGEIAKDKNTILWTIEANGRAIGTAKIELGRWDWVAVIEHFVIDPSMWGHGYGSDAALAVHRYAFDQMTRHRAYLEVAADNAAALHVAEKLGYTEYGRGREVYYRDGAYTDDVWLLCERDAWRERWPTEMEFARLPEGVTR